MLTLLSGLVGKGKRYGPEDTLLRVLGCSAMWRTITDVRPNCGNGFVLRPIRPVTEHEPGVGPTRRSASTARAPKMGPRRPGGIRARRTQHND
jgi:hypothetical protein